MEDLFLLVQKLLEEIPELNYVDLDTGQLMDEKPAITYPAVLFEIDIPNAEDMGGKVQECTASIALRIVTKAWNKTTSNTPETVINNSLEWLRLQQKVYKKFQGYGNKSFYPFSRRSGKNENIRKGLKTFALRFETSFHDYSANS